MYFYTRWISSPWREMPLWLRFICGLVYLGWACFVAYSVGHGLGEHLILDLAVACGIYLAIVILWRATHGEVREQSQRHPRSR